VATANHPEAQLAAQVRSLFVAEAAKLMVETASAVNAKLGELMDKVGNAREMQDRRDVWQAYQKARQVWADGTVTAWRKALVQPTNPTGLRLESGSLELMGDDVVENKIMSSRLSLRILDKASWELNDLKVRMQRLDKTTEPSIHDILRPEVVAHLLVEQWRATGMSKDAWLMVQDTVNASLAEKMVAAYHAANELLVQSGIMPEINLRSMVKRTPSGPGSSGPAPLAANSGLDASPQTTTNQPSAVMAPDVSRRASYLANLIKPAAKPAAQPVNTNAGAASTYGGGASGQAGTAAGGATGYGGGGGGIQGGGAQGGYGGAYDETRMLTATTPLSRARQRAQGVLGQLRRMLVDKVAEFDISRPIKPSPQFEQALANVQRVAREVPMGYEQTAMASGRSVVPVMSDAEYEALPSGARVEYASKALRQQTQTLKKAASTQSEKATIEIVALMFQSILAEERIPPGVRVWFARLQMPVLRLALSEPEFFESLQHPARRLIDRMGSCVLGFDAGVEDQKGGGALEAEVKRIVQTIEQYPETGRRVFQLVYDEFQKFLDKFLTEKGSTQKVVSLAQQVEQKETLAIQYTIELRNTLKDMPVPDAIREFLYKLWAEVLAVAAMRHGAQHDETMNYKQLAADLVWAAGAKPNRAERAKVIADLPAMLQRLRKGMGLLGLDAPTQDVQIKHISDTLAEAFMSKTNVIDRTRIDELSKRLINLEDYLEDVNIADVPLDQETIEMMGIDASDLVVIGSGGTEPTEAMRAWVSELQTGAWFTLDHNAQVMQVQYAWRSDKGHLHIFASTHGKSFLVQSRRMAAYLQAGLLTMVEDEALTVRATRTALAKLDANPERLLD
jgi:hypothetical protein